MNVIDALLAEHGVLYAIFEELEAAGDGGDPRVLARVLLAHAEVEDALLFPALEERIGAMGPLACMRSEHDEIHAALEALPAIPSGAERARALGELIAMARGHFAKEEQVLFQIARAQIPEAELIEMGRRWAERRRVLLADAA